MGVLVKLQGIAIESFFIGTLRAPSEVREESLLDLPNERAVRKT